MAKIPNNIITCVIFNLKTYKDLRFGRMQDLLKIFI